MEIEKLVDTVHTKEDLVQFLYSLARDLASNDKAWENPTLGGFLEACASWLEDSSLPNQAFDSRSPDSPTWKAFAHILAAGRIYE